LNFDAEVELAAPLGYTPSKKNIAFIEQNKTRVRDLTHSGVVLESGVVSKNSACELNGIAWCPTPFALRQLERSGAHVPFAPPLACLQRVNSRRFCAELGQTFPSAHFFENSTEVMSFLSRERGDWLLKRNFGFAARGQFRVGRDLRGAERWVAQGCAQGGIQVEPFVDVVLEVCLHGYLHRERGLFKGAVCRQTVDEHRSWASTRLLQESELDATSHAALDNAFEDSASALESEGYVGPFGIDAFVYRDAKHALRFNPRSEINARFTMGFAIGMSRHPFGDWSH
jgi:phosphoribosylaminoimidazole carboxylase (NCAIR synthetase)